MHQGKYSFRITYRVTYTLKECRNYIYAKKRIQNKENVTLNKEKH